jgi:hypothetical protein
MNKFSFLFMKCLRLGTTLERCSIIISMCIALGYGLDDRGSRVRVPAGAGKFFLHHGAYSASYPMGTRVSFPAGKAAGA